MNAIVSKRVLSGLVTPIIAGTVLTILAPLGTDNFTVPFRALYWIGLCLMGGLGAMVGQAILARFLPNVGVWMRTLIQSAAATLAVAPFVFFGIGQMTLAGMSLTLFYIWVIAIVITAVAELVGRKPTTSESLSQQRPALMDRLPIAMRDSTLYGVASEDHYVRIYTSSGEHMLLMRLADVEALAQPLKGLSPHRSWWVAEAGVASVKRESGKLVVQLKDGTRVPVSRAGTKRIKDAGWLN